MGTVPLGASGEHSASHLTPGQASSPSSWLMSLPLQAVSTHSHPSPGCTLRFALLCCLSSTAPVVRSRYQRQHPACLLDPGGEASALVTAYPCGPTQHSAKGREALRFYLH